MNLLALRGYRAFDGPHDGSSHGANPFAFVFGRIDQLHGRVVDENLFRIHLVFRQVFHIDRAEIAQPHV